MVGRPSTYTPEIAAEICNRIAKGESLKSICADEESGWLPGETTVRRWLAGEEDWSVEFRRQYACAREAQADYYAEEIIEISDGGEAGVDDSVVVARDRLRIDARKWAASKLAPKKYGDKVALTDPDGGPLQVFINKPAA